MTEEKFKAYVAVQKSGETNMFFVDNVIELSDFVLDKDDCMDIMQNYSTYEEEYCNEH